MDDDNRDIAIFIITHMINTCRALIIHGLDAKNILSSVFKRMGVVGVIVSDNMIKHLVLDYSCHRAEFSIEADFPAYLIFIQQKDREDMFHSYLSSTDRIKSC